MNSQLIEELDALGGEILPANLRDCDEIVLNQPGFSARIALWGGHLVSFKPSGQEDWLFQSENPGGQSRFGRRHFGVPVCWPWFGAHSDDEDMPAHGVARYFRWQLTEVGRFSNGDVKIVLSLASKDHPLIEEMVPQAFELRQIMRLGEICSVQLATANLSDDPMMISEALHTYLHIGDNAKARITGLEGCPYVDKFDGGAVKLQQGAIMPCDTLDRVYDQVPQQVTLHDPVFKRTMTITNEGSQSTVVWNPGEALAKLRTDLEDDEYRSFVCIEAANALQHAYHLAPGELRTLTQTIQCEPIGD
jgi:glucose-6-phosphate 1-epimerase